MEHKSKTSPLIKIILPLLAVGVIFAVWFVFDLQKSINAKDGPSDFQYIIVRDDRSQTAYFIDDPKQIDEFKSLYQKIPKGTMGYFKDGPNIHITFYKGNIAVSRLPYPADFSVAQKSFVKKLMVQDNARYAYTFHVPYHIDVRDLCPKIEVEKNCIAIYPSNYELRYAYPNVCLGYTAERTGSSEIPSTVEFGIFDNDNYFLPWIEKFKNEDNLFDISECFTRSISPMAYSRIITLYLKNSLATSEILDMKAVAESEYDRSLGVYGDRFIYREASQTKIELLFSEPQTNEGIENFCREYQINCYQYDKEPLNIEEIVFFYKYINAPMFRSYAISSNLSVVHHEYEEKFFVPFQDPTPNGIIISNTTISEDEYKYLVQVFSNNDFLSFPEKIVGGYDLESYFYIGVKINGDWHVSGGDTPNYKNERYETIYNTLYRKFELLTK